MAQAATKEPVVAHTGEKGTATVTVACKLPMGFELKVHKWVDGSEMTLHGPKPIKVAHPVGRTYTVRGPAHEVNKVAKAQVVGGYALTHGIPADFWDQWMRENEETHFVKNRIVFAASRGSMVAGQAKEQKEIRSNMEPLNPLGDPRTVKPDDKVKLEPDDEASQSFVEDED